MIKLGERIIRNKMFPYTHSITVSNPDSTPITWELCDEALVAAAAVGVSLTPSSGERAVGGSDSIELAFAPTEPGSIHFNVPLYINGGMKLGERPYLQLVFSATAATPRLSFDRSEVDLLAVPLGHTARTSFYVINEGYDNLQIDHALPSDTARMPIAIEFPEGTLVGVSKTRLLVTVSFTAKKPMAFTAPIELIDTIGNRFALPVTCTTDNCLLTLQPFLSAKGNDVQLLVRDGKPIVLSEAPAEEDAAALASFDSTNAAMHPSHVTDAVLDAAISELQRSAFLVTAYVCSSLMTLPGARLAGSRTESRARDRRRAGPPESVRGVAQLS